MKLWLSLALLLIIIAGAVAANQGRDRENLIMDKLVTSLMDGARASAQQPTGARVDFDTFSGLPAPVIRYFKHVLMDGQPFLAQAKIRQQGEQRCETDSDDWYPYTASHLIVPPVTGFAWIAKSDASMGTYVRMLESYNDGVGSSSVNLFAAFTLSSEQDSPELNAASLQHYLASTVWVPTSLLPKFGVKWTAIDDNTAMASLTVKETTVSLEFRFNKAGEVTGVYSPARFRLVDGEYRQQAWEAKFSDYQLESGMKIPQSTTSGWHEDGVLNEVSKGKLVKVQYRIIM